MYMHYTQKVYIMYNIKIYVYIYAWIGNRYQNPYYLGADEVTKEPSLIDN